MVSSFFVILSSRFGKKKEDKSKVSKNKLEALSEEELERIPNTSDRYESYGNGFLVLFHTPKEGKRTEKSQKILWVLNLTDSLSNNWLIKGLP